MFDVCPLCGNWHPDRKIVAHHLSGVSRKDETSHPHWEMSVCPTCGFEHPFRQLPLFVLTGASGTGKTSICCRLPAVTERVVALESDILWGCVPVDPDGGYATYRNLLLRICKNVSQAGKPVLLCGSFLPDHFNGLVERRYFRGIHFLALTLDDKELAARLCARPDWRACANPVFLSAQSEFNAWFRKNGTVMPESSSSGQNIPPLREPGFLTLDTSGLSLEESVYRVNSWMEVVLQAETGLC